jgi:low affinity Fe/Cu permease
MAGSAGLSLLAAERVKMRHLFELISRHTARAAGSWQASLAAFIIIIAWIIGGFFYGFLDPIYQLVINTLTTIITFLMVFLIQASQNRDGRAIQLKLDEIIRSIDSAHNALIGLEKMPEAELDRLDQPDRRPT